MTDYMKWLRELSEKGGKGTVDNIDARALGRAADELEYLEYLEYFFQEADFGPADSYVAMVEHKNKHIAELEQENARLQKQANCPYQHDYATGHICTKCGWFEGGC